MMIHCTDLIRALELYCRGYGDRGNLQSLLALARRNQEDSRVFAWQRVRLGALIARLEASGAGESASPDDALLAAHALHQERPPHTGDAGVR